MAHNVRPVVDAALCQELQGGHPPAPPHTFIIPRCGKPRSEAPTLHCITLISQASSKASPTSQVIILTALSTTITTTAMSSVRADCLLNYHYNHENSIENYSNFHYSLELVQMLSRSSPYFNTQARDTVQGLTGGTYSPPVTDRRDRSKRKKGTRMGWR
ncbi:hypothetical protein E2C01_026527 [Portunus trituberculatus]|uniref:Uncharacterized protein n=1 Tax=Portunus trituberculatus TaxID=210409 RepID=A0A5B7EL76_PORTR|nr:hypothetical protein [Portunus trituberculatus]